MKPVWLVLMATSAFAQAPRAASMKQLMLDLIHPASNEILLFVNRGAPKTDTEWAAVRRSAETLAESGTLLTTRDRARDQGEWTRDAMLLADVGAEAYKRSQAKDLPGLAALADRLDAACTTCHKQYRPNVFPHEGATK
jgi:cytochrome c556